MYVDGVITGTISYNLYEYNPSGQIVKIANYNANDNSPTGFINLSNTLYEYSGSGLKIKESIEFPVAGIEEYTVFEYKSNLLSQSKKYYRNNLESYSDYQYDGSRRLTKELTYSSDGKCLTYMIYSYSGSQLINSDLYTYPDKVLYRSITRTYDEGNNLIVLESREMAGYSSAMSYIMKYIYYQ